MAEDSGVRIEMALRSAMIAKSALDIIGSQPRLARLQLAEVMKMCGEFAKYLQGKESV
jgi:hypothetical protein